jgi:hypothetical protein
MEKNITKYYWTTVLGKIKERAWKESDMRGHLIAFLGFLLYGLIFFILYSTGIIKITLFNDLIVNVVFELATICIPFVLFTILLNISFAKIPAEMHSKLEQENKTFIEKLSNKNIKIVHMNSKLIINGVDVELRLTICNDSCYPMTDYIVLINTFAN